jgi:hypothetical protein
MDDLFERPLLTMWRHAYPSEDEKVFQRVMDETEEKATDPIYQETEHPERKV